MWGSLIDALTFALIASYKIGKGGRGGTKSWSFARAFLVQGWRDPIRFLCAREIQKSIKESVHQLLSDQVEKLGLGAFYDVLKNEIRGKNGTKFVFTGLSNLTRVSIKSYEGTNIFWVEEAENVSANSWETLIPTIRKDNSEIWVSFNNKNRNDPTYTIFVEKAGEDSYVRKVSWRDNPFFPIVLEKERLKLKDVDPEAYDHIC